MSIGAKLKQARKNKGLSIKDASAKTRIQEFYLKALENDDISKMPNTVYAKSFLKKYAECLGMDVGALLQEFENKGLAKPDQVVVLEGKEFPPINFHHYMLKISSAVLAFLMFLGLIMFLISSVHNQIKKSKASQTISQQKKTKLRSSSKESAKTKKQKNIKGSPLKTPAAVSGLQLSLVTKKPCRVAVKADKKLLFEDFLQSGKTDKWQAKQIFELSVSDGSAIEISLNGKKLGSLGRGAKKNILINKNGIMRR